MSELEEKLNALLRDPQLMQQIAGLAQTMGGVPPTQAPQVPEEVAAEQHTLDPSQLNLLMQAVNRSGVDQNQHALLHALSPYLSNVRIKKLERAMRAAKIAGSASVLFKSGSL